MVEEPRLLEPIPAAELSAQIVRDNAKVLPACDPATEGGGAG